MIIMILVTIFMMTMTMMTKMMKMTPGGEALWGSRCSGEASKPNRRRAGRKSPGGHHHNHQGDHDDYDDHNDHYDLFFILRLSQR